MTAAAVAPSRIPSPNDSKAWASTVPLEVTMAGTPASAALALDTLDSISAALASSCRARVSRPTACSRWRTSHQAASAPTTVRATTAMDRARRAGGRRRIDEWHRHRQWCGWRGQWTSRWSLGCFRKRWWKRQRGLERQWCRGSGGRRHWRRSRSNQLSIIIMEPAGGSCRRQPFHGASTTAQAGEECA